MLKQRPGISTILTICSSALAAHSCSVAHRTIYTLLNRRLFTLELCRACCLTFIKPTLNFVTVPCAAFVSDIPAFRNSPARSIRSIVLHDSGTTARSSFLPNAPFINTSLGCSAACVAPRWWLLEFWTHIVKRHHEFLVIFITELFSHGVNLIFSALEHRFCIFSRWIQAIKYRDDIFSSFFSF